MAYAQCVCVCVCVFVYEHEGICARLQMQTVKSMMEEMLRIAWE